MSQLEGFRIKNFKALKNITIGKLWNKQDVALSATHFCQL